MTGKKKGILIAAVCLAIVGIGLIVWGVRSRGTGSSDPGATAYVEEVANLKDTGMLGMTNRYSGLVESQETWSVNQNPETTVKEMKVHVGDEVKKGDVLFVYNTDKYESDLAQAQIDLERLNNEVTTIGTTVDQLTKEKAKAPASEQANYTIQIQEQQLQQQEKQLAIQSKQVDIDKLNDNIAHAEVKSEMDGVVKKINDGTTTSYDGTDTSFITIMKLGDYRIKGSVNEQNIGALAEGTPVIVHSRVDAAQTWTGTITKVDTENANSNQNSMYYYGGDGSQNSTSYPFYVQLDDCEGLMLGQHVYLEPDYGQSEAIDKSEGIWIGSYMVDETEPEHPFVWADNGRGKLEKRSVTIGERDDMYMEVQILDGLTDEDKIAIPDGTQTEGMATAPMSEMPMDMGYTDEGVYSDSATMDMGDMEMSEEMTDVPADDMTEAPADEMTETSGTEDGAETQQVG